MTSPVAASKLFIPAPGSTLVSRPRLVESLNEGLRRKLTLISAPAGFGKTTLASEWIGACGRPAAWLSLDEGDNDPARFLSCLVAALKTIQADLGSEASSALQSPCPQPTASVLTALLNELSVIPGDIVLMLDDYHLIEAGGVDDALAFMVERLPPRMHLAIATREDPDLPLARLRARGQLTEVRAADLRFTPAEAGEFLNRAMGLDLSAEDVGALETRTEGWIAGLQLAALSMRGRGDAGSFIRSFTGSNSFVMDFLIEEVLRRQPESVQAFLVCTSILDRFCGPLCDAVLSAPAASGQEALEYLQRANLFIVPLDSERRWYRYHRLFAELLRERLRRLASPSAAELHARASRWYEDNGLEIEAFHHAVAADDVERAERLIEGKGRPLYFRGAMTPVLLWLETLPPAVMDARPSLWVAFASVSMLSGRPTRVEDKLRAAETALQRMEEDQETRDLAGHMAVLRATVATAQYRVDEVLAQSQRALELLSPNNLPVRTFNTLAQGFACQLQGNLEGAARAFTEVMSIGQAAGLSTLAAAAAAALGQVQEAENRLRTAADTYRRMLQMVGDPAHMYNYAADLGLARISCEWNDLDAALEHCEQCVRLAPLIECMSPAESQVMLARVMLARGDTAAAAATLEKAAEAARLHRFEDLTPAVAAAQVIVFLRQGTIAAAARLAEKFNLPVSRARVRLAQGNPSAALAVLGPLIRNAEAGGPQSELLILKVLQALAVRASGDKDVAVQLLGKALAMAEPGGFIRLFIDEGAPMTALLCEALAQGIMPDYAEKLIAVFRSTPGVSPAPSVRLPVDALSQREVEILKLIAQGLSNQEIAERLFVALSTVKGHNQSIFSKLQVQRRAEAIARARELGLA